MISCLTDIRTSTRSKCVIHYICTDYSTHAQFSASIIERDLDLHSILATKCGFFTERSGFLSIDQTSFEARVEETREKHGVGKLQRRLQSRSSRR